MPKNMTQIIFDAIDEINKNRPEDEQLGKTLDTKLLGGGLDSLALIDFVLNIEQKVEQETGDVISLANEDALSLSPSPFRTVGLLVDYISTLLKENPSE